MDRKAKAFKNAENKKNLIKSQTDSGNFISTNFKTVSPATSSFRSLPSPSTTRTYSLTSTGSNYPWSVRASSVPLSPTTNPTQFTRSSSAKEDSSGRENDDRDSARKLIKNLVTIFSHSRSPTSSSESSRESSIVSLQDKKTPLPLRNSQSLQNEASTSLSDDLAKTDVSDSVHTFHSPVSSPSPPAEMESTLCNTTNSISSEIPCSIDFMSNEDNMAAQNTDFFAVTASLTKNEIEHLKLDESANLTWQDESFPMEFDGSSSHTQSNSVSNKEEDSYIATKDVTLEKASPTVKGVTMENGVSETMSAVNTEEERELTPSRKINQSKKEKVSRLPKQRLRSKRRYLPSRKKAKQGNDKELAPPALKRSRRDNDSPVPSRSKPQPKLTPPKGNVLATILTDIPEVDIFPLSAHKSSPVTSSPKHITSSPKHITRRKATGFKQEHKPSIPPTRSRTSLSRSKHSSSVSKKKIEIAETGHYKLLMRWEKDVALGSTSQTAPMLYANEHMTRELAADGPWLDKAKQVWATWRRGVSQEKKNIYLKRAKRNRIKAKSGSKCKNDHVSTAPSDETRSEDDLLSSPADSVTKHTATKETSSMDNVSTIVDKKIKVSEKTLNGAPAAISMVPSLVTPTPSVATPTFSNAMPTLNITMPTFPRPVSASGSFDHAPLSMPRASFPLGPPISQWQGFPPFQFPLATIPQVLPAPREELVKSKTETLKKKTVNNVGHTSFNLSDILSTKHSADSKSSTSVNYSSPNVYTQAVLSNPSLQTLSGHKKCGISAEGIPAAPSVHSCSITTCTHELSSSVSSKNELTKVTKMRKKEGLSSRFSSLIPLASPSFVIPQLDKNSPTQFPSKTISNKSKLSTQSTATHITTSKQAPPTLPPLPYVPPSMLASSYHMSLQAKGTVPITSNVRSRSVSLSSSGGSSSASSSAYFPFLGHSSGSMQYPIQGIKQHHKKKKSSNQSMSFPSDTIVSTPSPHTAPSMPHTIPSTPHTTPSTPLSPLSPSSYYSHSQYKMSILKKMQDFYQMRPRKRSTPQEISENPNQEDSTQNTPSQSIPSSQPFPLIVQPAMYFNEKLNTPTSGESTSREPAPLQIDSSVTSRTSSSSVKPSLMVNASFVGDFSSMSLWEMEQLYAYNKAILHRQKKITLQIKAQLLKMQQQERVNQNKKLSRSDLYKRFLNFLVEPKYVPTCDLTKPLPTGKNKDILDPSYSDRPVLRKEFDVYGSLSKTEKSN